MNTREMTRRELLKVLLGLPLAGIAVAAVSPILRLLKPFGKLGLEIPPAPVARMKLDKVKEPQLNAAGQITDVMVDARYSQLKTMVGYSFEIETVDTSIPYKPVRVFNPGILIKDDKGELHVFDAKCTHLACVVRWDFKPTGEGYWHCRCHDGVFHPTTAEVVAGPPPTPLKRWKCDVELAKSTDEIWVEKV